jgi:serine/threonine-protein kinase RsbW
MPQKNHLQVNTDLNSLAQVLSWFDQLDRQSVPEIIWLQCRIALAEGFTNAARHAHKDKSLETPIDVEVVIFTQYLKIQIWDYGDSFNLEQKLRDIPEQVDENDESGRGLRLMQKIADHLSYVRVSDNQNYLSIVKYYPSS